MEKFDNVYGFLEGKYLEILYSAAFMLLFYYVVYKSIKKTWNCPYKLLSRLLRAIEENNNIESIQLIQKNPQMINEVFNDDGYTPFLLAALRGNTQLVKFMLAHGAHITASTYHKENAFYLAAYLLLKERVCKNASCIHALYHAGVDINKPNRKGYNALQMAAVFGHIPLIKWLLSKHANTEVQPDPFMLAHTEGHQEAAKIIFNSKKKSITI